ncbi:DivIVA domain-containing protein [Glutamicibacter sp. MNS18]|uniref:DivIVA domain-containing protein n=1 Tax=Glutamicibacter sp. MNS18 TaxID=2989817 RepID=UPI002235F3E8|nr:DivIVA domain-containing protein [Glutamicibacter sp. MNS18]MCW4464329.1 DivIVA domain-containing protein [Glutamicibacter sp. MNS18]
MPFMLIALALLICAAAAFFLTMLRKPAQPVGKHFSVPREPVSGLIEPEASLPPVLLPVQPSRADVDAVRFSIGLRGYRCDQVDDVLDRLAGRIEELENKIRDIESRRVISDTSEN